jgi:hypothetical protein
MHVYIHNTYTFIILYVLHAQKELSRLYENCIKGPFVPFERYKELLFLPMPARSIWSSWISHFPVEIIFSFRVCRRQYVTCILDVRTHPIYVPPVRILSVSFTENILGMSSASMLSGHLTLPRGHLTSGL